MWTVPPAAVSMVASMIEVNASTPKVRPLTASELPGFQVRVTGGFWGSLLSKSPALATYVSVGKSSFVISSWAEPSMKPGALAETVTTWLPSKRVSSTAVSGKIVETCPAGMVAEDGTVASDSSLLRRLTMSSPAVSVFRETVTVVLPPFSEMLGSSIERVRVAVKSSKAPISTVPSAIRGNPGLAGQTRVDRPAHPRHRRLSPH